MALPSRLLSNIFRACELRSLHFTAYLLLLPCHEEQSQVLPFLHLYSKLSGYRTTSSRISHSENRTSFPSCIYKFVCGYCFPSVNIFICEHISLKKKMPVDLYQLPLSAPCRAVVMTAQHIGVEINSKTVDLMAGEQLKPEYIQMNPQHTVPTIDDGGFYLWESRAIQTYLVNKYAPDSPVYPKDPQERAVVDRMLYFDMGTLYKAESEYLYPQLFKGEAADSEKEETFKKALTFLEEFLNKTSHVAGNHITLADFSILASLTFAELVDYNFKPYPKISAWLQKVKSEVPNHKEINEVPINQFKEFLKSKK